MKCMKKLFAAVLALALVLALTAPAMAAAKIKAGDYVELKRDATAYSAAKNSKATKNVAMKGSIAQVTKVSGKFAKVVVNPSSNKTVYFKTSDLKISTSGASYIIVGWIKGGDGMSKAVDGSKMSYEPEKKKVKVTQTISLRKGYSLSHKTAGTVKKGKVLKYRGYVGFDDRGIMWFNVSYKNKSLWISSICAQLQ